MRLLSVDVGSRRTGIAFFDESVGIPLPLDTVEHETLDDLLIAVKRILSERSVGTVIVGLPLLLSGKEGEQCTYVRDFLGLLEKEAIPFRLIDERYTTPNSRQFDGDAAAACTLLQMALERDEHA